MKALKFTSGDDVQETDTVVYATAYGILYTRDTPACASTGTPVQMPVVSLCDATAVPVSTLKWVLVVYASHIWKPRAWSDTYKRRHFIQKLSCIY
jgi:hypothetical protein